MQHASSVPSQLRHLGQRGVLPHGQLVLGVAVGGDQLLVVSGPLDRADLGTSVDLVHAGPGLGVPEPQGSVGRSATARQQVGLPRAPVQSFHSSNMLAQGVGRGDLASLAHLRGVPDVENVVVATRGQLGAIRRPLQPDDLLGVSVFPAREEGVLLADVAVHDGVVAASGGQDMFVPGQGSNSISMVVEAPQLLTLVHVPELDTGRAVGGADGDVGGGKGNPGNGGDSLAFFHFHQLLDFSGGGVPQVNALVQGHSEDVVLGPVEEVEVVVVLHFRCVKDALGERRDVAEVGAVLLVGNFVVGVEDRTRDRGRNFFGDGGLGLEGKDLGVVELAVVQGVGQKGLVIVVVVVFSHHAVVRQVEVGQIGVHGRPVGNKTIAFL